MAEGTRAPVHPDKIEQFFAVRRYLGNLAFSPQGDSLTYCTDTSGQFNLWQQPAGGGWPSQRTLFEERSVRTFAWSWDGSNLYFLADANGDEFYQLYQLPASGGWPDALTDRPQVQFHLAPEAVSPDGSRLAFSGNERVPTDVDVLIRDLATGEQRTVLAGGGYYNAAGWSPDGHSVLAVRANSNADTDLFLVDLAGKSRHLTPHEGQVVYSPGPWKPDGSGFYLVSDRGHETQGLGFYDLGQGDIDWIETPPWDVEDLALTRDGRFLAWSVNEEGYSRLYVRDLQVEGGKTLVKLPELPAGVLTALTWSPDGRKMAVRYSGPRQAAEIYVLDLHDAGLRRITNGMLGGIDASRFVDPELVHFPTYDGRGVPGFLYRPRSATGRAPVAAVLSIHGGPEAQERPSYQPFYQYLVSLGIAVLAPNIRGSTGYGKSYQREIYRDWGGNELRDIEAAAQYLQALSWVDASRLGVFGGSFGGFATLSAISRLPQYWAAAVDICGPSNLVSFVRAVPPTWRRFLTEWVGDPEADREMLLGRSPIRYVEDIRAPLLILQGAKDPRVVPAESEQMVEQLRAHNRTVAYTVYDDEGHGFTRRSNQIDAFRRSAEFFERYLLH